MEIKNTLTVLVTVFVLFLIIVTMVLFKNSECVVNPLSYGLKQIEGGGSVKYACYCSPIDFNYKGSFVVTSEKIGYIQD